MLLLKCEHIQGKVMTELGKLNKKSKTLIIFSTVFALLSTHLCLIDTTIDVYLPVMFTILVILFMNIQAELHSVNAWEIIDSHHQESHQYHEIFLDNINKIIKLNEEIVELKKKLKEKTG